MTDNGRTIGLAYEAAGNEVIKPVLLLEYHCRKRCLLLHAWRSPAGILFYQPAYKLSPARNADESVESARVKGTADGERRWNSRGGSLDALRGFGAMAGLSLQCDHVQHLRTAAELTSDADKASPGSPTRRTF